MRTRGGRIALRRSTIALVRECAADAERALRIVRFLEESPSTTEPEAFLRAAHLEAEAASLRGFAFAGMLHADAREAA